MRKASGKIQWPQGKRNKYFKQAPETARPAAIPSTKALLISAFDLARTEPALPRSLVENDAERDGHVQALDGRAHRDSDALVGLARLRFRQSACLRPDDDGARNCPVNLGVRRIGFRVGAYGFDSVRATPAQRFLESGARPERQPERGTNRDAQRLRRQKVGRAARRDEIGRAACRER